MDKITVYFQVRHCEVMRCLFGPKSKYSQESTRIYKVVKWKQVFNDIRKSGFLEIYMTGENFMGKGRVYRIGRRSGGEIIDEMQCYFQGEHFNNQEKLTRVLREMEVYLLKDRMLLLDELDLVFDLHVETMLFMGFEIGR